MDLTDKLFESNEPSLTDKLFQNEEVDLTSKLFPEESTVEPIVEPAPVVETSGPTPKEFYTRKAFSGPVQGMIPGIAHPALSAYMGMRGFGPKPEGGWDEFGRPLDAEGKPYYIEGVDPSKAGNWLAETFKGLSTLASHPMETIKGGLDFLLALPAMTVGLLGAAGRGANEVVRQIAFGDLNLETIYDAMSKGMQESFEFFEPGKQLIAGEPTEESQLMTQVMMVPLSVPSALGHKVAAYEGFKDSPNIRGAAKILGDTIGFATMGLAFRGLFHREKASELESIVKKADEIRAREQAVQAIPEDVARVVQQKMVDIQKQRLEARAAEFAKKLGEDALVVEEMGRLKEEVAKAKARPLRDTGLNLRKAKEAAKKAEEKVKEEITAEDAQALADAKRISDIEKHYKKPIEKISDKEIEDYITGEKVDWFGEGRRVTEVDRAIGEKIPELEGEAPIFLQNRAKTDQMAKIYEERQKAVSENPELYVQKLVNDVNRWYHGDENVDIAGVRNALSTMAGRAPELRELFITGYDHIAFSELASEAANWARKLERLEIPTGNDIWYHGRSSKSAPSGWYTQDIGLAKSHAKKQVKEFGGDPVVDVNRSKDLPESAFRLKETDEYPASPEEYRKLHQNIGIRKKLVPEPRQTINLKKGGVQLNVMIPVDQVPMHVKKAIVGIKQLADKVRSLPGMKKRYIKFADLYRNESLFDKTGFWLGRDGKWRYELDDSKARYTPGGFKLTTDGTYSASMFNILDYPELYKAVPEVKYIRVFVDPGIKVLGTYSPTGIITIRSRADKATLIHELQHAVNEKAGAFKGSSPEAQFLAGRQMLALNRLKEIKSKIKSPDIVARMNEEIAELRRQVINDTYDTDWPRFISGDLAKFLEASGESTAAEIARFPLGNIPDAFTRYKKVPGEMEARLAEARMNMSAKERAKTPPWETLDKMLTKEYLRDHEMFRDKPYFTDPGTKLYSGLDVSEGAKKAIEGAKRVSEYTSLARGMKKFKPRQAAEMLKEEFIRSFVDRSGNIRRQLLDQLGDEGYEILQKMYLAKGASSVSANMLRQMRKEVYAGLSRREKKILDDIILDDRMIDIGKYKTEKEFKHPKGLKLEDFVAHRDMFQRLEKLSPERAAEISKRADAYFEWMKKPLKDMLDAGLISKEEYDALSSHNYRRIKLVDIYDKRYNTRVGKKARTVYDSGVEALSKGRETDIYEPSSEIMALEVFNRAYGRIMNNEANKTLLELARRDPENPFVRVKTKDSKIPSGWNRVFLYEGGKKKNIYLSPEMSKEWIINSPELSYRTGQVLRYASGSPVLRTFATGINWGFALANLPRDVMHAWYAARIFEDGKWKPLYNPNLPIYGLQIGRDLATVFLDAALKKGRYEDYINQGGGMEFLVHQGRLFQRGRHLEGPIDLFYKVMGYFGELSEIITRLAIRERALRKGKSPQEATFAARDYMDFGQGGGIAKAADNAIPYLNASIQGTRGLLRAFKDNPISSTYKLSQLAALTTGVYIAAKHYAPKTIEEVKNSIDSQNNLIIPLPDSFRFIDERGQERGIYFKIPLDPGQRFFKKFFEASTDKWLGEEIDVDGTVNALTQLSPVGVSSLPPSVASVLGYVMNKDFWLNEDIWKQTEPFSYPGSKEEYTSRTPEAFTKFGKATGMSPERTRYAVQQLVTRGTLFSYLLGEGYEATFGDLPKERKEQHLAMVLDKLPVARRFISATNPYTRYAAGIDEAQEKAVIKHFVENRNFDIKVEGYIYGEKGLVTRDELFKEARKHGDKDTFNRLIDRWKFEEAIKNLPNKNFWRRMKGLRLEAKAEVFVDRLESASPEEKNELWREYSIVSRAKGVLSPEFRKEVIRQISNR